MLSSFAFYTWQILFTPNLLVDAEDRLLMIPKGSTFRDVQNKLYDQGFVQDPVSFGFLARLKDYDKLVKPGLYQLEKDMTNLEAINLLRSGTQTPVQLTFTNARKLNELPEKIANFMEFSEEEMAEVLLADTTPGHYGFDSVTFIAMFIPNTYEVYWTATPKEILDRLKNEYDRFWNEEREKKAEKIGLTPVEVSTLASIVEAETNKMDEAPTIAGVYLNRLEKGYKLQADPTLVYALNDFSIRRVLNVHKQVESPYNTYKYSGLPPGPINMPSIPAINSVLNYESHNYLYFVAKADFSGYHAFSRNLIEHNRKAREFQKALNKERIFR